MHNTLVNSYEQLQIEEKLQTVFTCKTKTNFEMLNLFLLPFIGDNNPSTSEYQVYIIIM